MASVVGTSDNPQIREFNRRKIVSWVHDQIMNRKLENRVKESQLFLDALGEMHEDIVFECTVAERRMWVVGRRRRGLVVMWRRLGTYFMIQRRSILIRLKFKCDGAGAMELDFLLMC
jgi:hypothetical protein